MIHQSVLARINPQYARLINSFRSCAGGEDGFPCISRQSHFPAAAFDLPAIPAALAGVTPYRPDRLPPLDSQQTASMET